MASLKTLNVILDSLEVVPHLLPHASDLPHFGQVFFFFQSGSDQINPSGDPEIRTLWTELQLQIRMPPK